MVLFLLIYVDVAGPMITFLLNHLKLAGCPFPSSALQCHPCPENRAGGFSPDHGILLCQDRFFNKKHMEDTLAHELLHAFDHCRFKVDWGNLRHHACSEVGVWRVEGKIEEDKDERLLIS